MSNSIFLFFTLVLLTGCSFIESPKENSARSMLLETFKIAFPSIPELDSRQKAEKLPYATIGVSFNGNHPVLMPLARKEDAILQWVSSDFVSITTLHGRIQQLYTDRISISQIHISPLHSDYSFESARSTQTVSAPVHLDIDSKNRYDVIGQATLRYEGTVNRDYWQKMHPMWLFSEEITIASESYTNTNYYWLVPNTNVVWESTQQWWPKAPQVHYRMLNSPTSVSLSR
ncbi:MAG: YjbF family lipoprotein [Hydrogenovibrio sp.]|uniref:YjbF family lipoprotein n=1 Tax=Hydrogenovibrio sp. TaxID=2065821 RepID=UPI00286FDEDD|nr:YjbF family lipoprotein [Hydrogenovibrio sp.]MDR9500074.1 YjbF family lipoprotein [Hydrogenovibrio sp.]